MKYLIVNADDFGASDGVNRGIVDAHVNGIVTSASLMVDRAAAHEAAALAADHPNLSVGLHWEIDDVDHDDEAAVREACERQLEAFVAIVGRPPTHVDSHHHVHRDPRVAEIAREVVEPLGVPVRGDGRAAYVGGFYAQWEWGVTELRYVSFDFLVQLLREEVDAGWTELGCHPGYVTPGFSSTYLEEREAEVRTLTDPRLPAVLDDLGIRLAGFAELGTAPRT